MGKSLSKVYVLEKTKFDQDPIWIEHFSAIQCPLKEQWVSMIRQKETYLPSLDYLRRMTDDVYEYYSGQRGPLTSLSYILYSSPCHLVLKIFTMSEDLRKEHLESCHQCSMVYHHSVVFERIKDISDSLNEEIKSLSDLEDEEISHVKKLIGFLETECYREILEIPNELSEKQITLANKRHLRMTMGELFELLHDIRIYNEASSEFERHLGDRKDLCEKFDKCGSKDS